MLILLTSTKTKTTEYHSERILLNTDNVLWMTQVNTDTVAGAHKYTEITVVGNETMFVKESLEEIQEILKS